jgi:serine/threonine protein kinase
MTVTSVALLEPLQPRLPEDKVEEGAARRQRPVHLVRQLRLTDTTLSSTQEWFSDRLTHDVLAFFHEHTIAICAPPSIKRLPAFHGVWCTISAGSSSLMLNNSHVTVALMFCDPSDSQQMKLCIEFMRKSSPLTPPIMLIAHSVAPYLRCQALEDDCLDAISDIMAAGADDVILGEPAGAALINAVRIKSIVGAHRMRIQDDHLEHHFKQLEAFESLKEQNHAALFAYARHRFKLHLPPEDPNTEGLEDLRINDLQVGALLGQGAYATVFKLERSDAAGIASNKVLKVMPKRKIMNLQDLFALETHIQMMMRVSSKGHTHPNLVKMYHVYHTRHHVCIEMEDAGSMNLSKRLRHRELHEGWSLSPFKVKSIIEQASAALAHLHVQLRISHRDIKPENIIIAEDDADIQIKLADFDMAILAGDKREVASEVVGTFPFMAPELVLKKRSLVQPTDVWSMALTFMELICRLKCVESNLKLSLPASYSQRKQQLAKNLRIIHDYFETPQFVVKQIDREMQSELQDMKGAFGVLLEGMLQVLPDKRWTAAEVMEALPLLSAGVPSSLAGSAGALRRPRSP